VGILFSVLAGFHKADQLIFLAQLAFYMAAALGAVELPHQETSKVVLEPLVLFTFTNIFWSSKNDLCFS
jgi:hypothetical protein